MSAAEEEQRQDLALPRAGLPFEPEPALEPALEPELEPELEAEPEAESGPEPDWSESDDVPAVLKSQMVADWARKLGESAANSALASLAVVEEARLKAASDANPGAGAITKYVANLEQRIREAQYADEGLNYEHENDEPESWIGGASQSTADATLVIGCCAIITAVVSVMRQ